MGQVGAAPFSLAYAELYDALHAGKDYPGEAGFVWRKARELAGAGKPRILDLACGTGRHAAALLDLGARVHANDLSPAMIEVASRRLAAFGDGAWTTSCGPMQALASAPDCRGPFDVAVAFYTALGYLVSSAALVQCLEGLGRLLRPGGLFFADLWNGHRMAHEYSPSRAKSATTATHTVRRVSHVTPAVRDNALKVDFEFSVTEKATGKSTVLTEAHLVRYHTLPEIEALLVATGFELVEHGPFFEDATGLEDCWNFYVLARKRETR